MKFKYIDQALLREYEGVYEEYVAKKTWENEGAPIIADKWNNKFWPDIQYDGDDVVRYEKITIQQVNLLLAKFDR